MEGPYTKYTQHDCRKSRTSVQHKTIPSIQSKENVVQLHYIQMDYCSKRWGNATTSNRIYKRQRRAARIITDSEYRGPSNTLALAIATVREKHVHFIRLS